MQAQSERGGTATDFVSGARLELLDNLGGQFPLLEISKSKSWPSIAALSYHRGEGEGIWRSDRNRLVLTLDEIAPRLLQIEQGPTLQIPPTTPGSLTFCPAGLTTRNVLPAARLIQVTWDMDLYSVLLPELGASVSRFEHLHGLQDPLLSQIVTSLAREIEGGFADLIMVESLSGALCIRIARRFVGYLSLPTTKGLSPKRMRRVRDYIEAHLGEELSLTCWPTSPVLAPITLAVRSRRRPGSGRSVMSCNAGSITASRSATGPRV